LHAEFVFRIQDKSAKRIDDRLVSASRSMNTSAKQFLALFVERQNFDFGSAQVDTQFHE
jgi:hypothetical protein